jgi:RNA polymerase sigma factor (sigma-70 family)
VPAGGSIDPARVAEKKDEWDRFLAAAAELPEREAAVFERIYFERMSQQEVAEELGVSVALVRLRWAEAKKSLAERLCGVAKTGAGGE